jgi:hypothetical protein
MILAWACGAAALILGIIAVVKSNSLSISVVIVILITFLTTIYGIAEVAFPH